MNTKKLEKILLRCFIISVGIQLLWVTAILTLGEQVSPIHMKLFSISKEYFYRTNYISLAFFKLFTSSIFLIPFIALKIGSKDIENKDNIE